MALRAGENIKRRALGWRMRLTIETALQYGDQGVSAGDLVERLAPLIGLRKCNTYQLPWNAARAGYLSVRRGAPGQESTYFPGLLALPPECAPPRKPMPGTQRAIPAAGQPLPTERLCLRSVFECVIEVPLRDPCGVHGELVGAGAPKR